MKKTINKWNVLVYALIIINLALIFVYIVSSRTNIFLSNVINDQNNSQLSANIQRKADIAFKYDYLYNQDWSWFTNTRLCPSSIVFSWTTASGTIITITGSTAYFDSNNTIYCSWSNNYWTTNIYFSNDFLSFSWITFSGSSLRTLTNDNVVTVTWWLTFTGNVFSWSINDSQNSIVTFSWNIAPSHIDANFNSDNYMCSSTWIINYPNFSCDDDINARKNITWYIESTWWYFNVFWNNSRISDFIADNPNNTNSWVALLWNTWTWLLFLTLSDFAYIKLIQFDKTKYDSTNELVKTGEYDWYMSTTSSWYIAFSGSNIVLNPVASNTISFDFVNNYYALFLSYSWWTYGANLQYTLSWTDANGYPIILNPLDDYDPNYFKFLGYDIILRDDKYYSKIEQIEAPKSSDIIKNNFVN